MPNVGQCTYAHRQTVDRLVKEEFMLGNRLKNDPGCHHLSSIYLSVIKGMSKIEYLFTEYLIF